MRSRRGSRSGFCRTSVLGLRGAAARLRKRQAPSPVTARASVREAGPAPFGRPGLGSGRDALGRLALVPAGAVLRAAHGEGEKRLVGLFRLLDDLEGDAGGVLGRAVPGRERGDEPARRVGVDVARRARGPDREFDDRRDQELGPGAVGRGDDAVEREQHIRLLATDETAAEDVATKLFHVVSRDAFVFDDAVDECAKRAAGYRVCRAASAVFRPLPRARPPHLCDTAGAPAQGDRPCPSTASTTSPRSPATPAATATSTPGRSACGSSRRPSTSTIPAPTTSISATRRGGPAPS